MEQEELSKLRNDKIIVIKPADKGVALWIISIGHYESMIMEYLEQDWMKVHIKN